MTQWLNPACSAALHWCRCRVCILSLSAWHLLCFPGPGPRGRTSVRVSEHRVTGGSDTVSPRLSAVYLLPRASRVAWIHPNHPPVTFDTVHMMRLKPLLVALRLEFLSAIWTRSPEVTHPSKAYVETHEKSDFYWRERLMLHAAFLLQLRFKDDSD